MILSSEIWSERKMAEMSSTIVWPILFKQIARAERHRDAPRLSMGEGERQKERVRSVNERLCVIQCVCVVNNWKGCQESGEIKVNNSGKCVCICTLLLIA